MFLDLHEHTGGISWCCKMDAKQIVAEAKKVGLDGFVLTNHYCKVYTKEKGFDAWLEDYIREADLTADIAEKEGMRVLFGVEVTMEYDQRIHILLYGVDAAFLRTNKELYLLSPKQLHELCRQNGIFMVQAHPYRNGTVPLPIEEVDGYEINCHPKYKTTCSQELLTLNRETGILLTCGCDYHGDTDYRPCGGVLLPDDITDTKKLTEYLFSTDRIQLRIHEVDAPAPYDIEVKVTGNRR